MSSFHRPLAFIFLTSMAVFQPFMSTAVAAPLCSEIMTLDPLDSYYGIAIQGMERSWQRKLTHDGSPHLPEQTPSEARELGFASFNIVNAIVNDLKSGDDSKLPKALEAIAEYKIYGLQYDQPWTAEHPELAGQRVLNQDLIEDALKALLARTDLPADLREQAQALFPSLQP